MNCKHVQELLPLYVGRDLEEKRARLVTAHVQSCAQCARSAEEYREAAQLLQLFRPPPFSEAVYAGIRSRVLREIRRESTAPTLLQLVAGLFRPRIRWAVATALLLAVCVFAFYFVARLANDRRDGQQVAGTGGTVDMTGRDEKDRPPSLSIKESGGLAPGTAGQQRGPLQGLTAGTHQRPKRIGTASDRTRPATVNSAEPWSMSAQTLPDGINPPEPDAALDRDSATSEKALRVEIQTSDRNIRIIWFTHQRTKQDSQNKFSKGT